MFVFYLIVIELINILKFIEFLMIFFSSHKIKMIDGYSMNCELPLKIKL